MIKKTFSIFALFIVCVGVTQARATEKKKQIAPASPIAVVQDTFLYSFYEGVRLKNDPDSLNLALEKFEFCLQTDSTDAGAYAEAAAIYAVKKETNKAISYFEKACKLSANNWWYSVRLISLYAEANQIQKAVGLAEDLSKKYPQKDDIYNILISLYKDTKQYKKAIDAYNHLEKIYGINETFAFNKFQLYLELNQAKKGVAEIDRLIHKYPTETRYRILRGDIYLQQKQTQKAFDVYSQVLREDPSNPYIYVSLSDYYSTVNEPDKAIGAIVTALKSDQLVVDEKLNILSQYIQKLISDTTRLDENESLFKLLTERYPFEEKVHEYYAQFLGFRNRNAEAIQEYETIISINPRNENAWIQIAQNLVREQKFDDMLRTVDRAIQSNPESSFLYFYKGIAEFQLDKMEPALDSYKKSAQFVKPEQALFKSDIYAQIGDVYYKLGNKEGAFAAYEEAVVANPKNAGALNNYAYYLSVEKTDLSKAEKMSAQTINLEPENSTYLDTYAWIFYQRENYSLAKFYIERAVKNLKPDQDPGVVLEHYGDILFKNGSKDKAMEMWTKSYDGGNKTDELKLKIDSKGEDVGL